MYEYLRPELETNTTQTPSTIVDCLPAWLSVSDPLPIDFVLDKPPHAPVNKLVPACDFGFCAL